jgi:NAD(P)-dependent dehydrogenase (short-subunit alcohol dehydrogenase family)
MLPSREAEARCARFERSSVENLYAQCLRTIPAGRIGRPADIANCVLFLCSKQAAYVNGAALDVHGGLVSGGDWGFPF